MTFQGQGGVKFERKHGQKVRKLCLLYVIYSGYQIGYGASPAEHGAVAERGGGLLVVRLGPPADVRALGHRERRGHGRSVQVIWKSFHFVIYSDINYNAHTEGAGRRNSRNLL